MEILKVPVLIADGTPDKSGDIISSGTDIEFNSSVCVMLDGNAKLSEAVGTAHLKKSGNTLFADISILEGVLSNKEIETLTPSISGVVLKSVVDMTNKQRFITNMKINSISLNLRGNLDKRIKRLK